MYTLLESISPISKLLLFGSEPDISAFSMDQLKNIEIPEESLPVIIENSKRNNLLPLLYKNLKNHPHISAGSLEKIKKEVLKTSMQLLKQEAVFRELNDNLKECSVDFRILKGFYLGKVIYPESYLRPMVDLDIMIRPEQIIYVNNLLKSKGFVSYAIAEHEFLSNQKHHPYGLKFKGVNIELHKSIFADYDPERIKESLLWENPLEFFYFGNTVKTLSAEVFLFHLCHHLMGHLRGDFIKLIWCRDIAEFIKSFGKKLNWEYFLQLYNESGAEEDLLYGIWFASDWMNADVPQTVLDKIKMPGESIAQDFIWFTGHKKNFRLRPHLINKYKQVTGMKNKAKFLMFKVFPIPEYLMRYYRKNKYSSLLVLYPRYISEIFARGLNAIFSKIKAFTIRKSRK